MTACPRAPTIDTAGGPPAGRQKELPMADSDLGAQFEKVSDKAKAATDKLKDATSRTRDQLQSDVAGARDKAVAAADQFKDKADAAQARASSQWQEIRNKWQAHVATVRTNIDKKEAELDAKEASREADMAEDYALDAIDFAQARDRGSGVRSTRCRVRASRGQRAQDLTASLTARSYGEATSLGSPLRRRPRRRARQMRSAR